MITILAVSSRLQVLSALLLLTLLHACNVPQHCCRVEPQGRALRKRSHQAVAGFWQAACRSPVQKRSTWLTSSASSISSPL